MRLIWGAIIWAILAPTFAHAETIETDFARTADQVKSSLIQAPEASEIYLKYWIDIYNTQADDLNRPKIELPPTGPVVKISNKGLSLPDAPWVPNGAPIVSPEWGQRKPISFQDTSEYLPDPPPLNTDVQFEIDIEEVFRVGEKYGVSRTTDQTVTAAYWADGIGTVTPPGRWNLIALQETEHLEDFERTQILTALNIALYDAGIVAWESKYQYNYWRPTTAIISKYPAHSDWQPMLEPPFHPEYVSGHSTFSGAAARILTAFLGNRPFCLSSEELLELERCFTSFNAAAQEAGRSRVYGGIHFEFSNQAGLRLGEDVASQVLQAFPNHFPNAQAPKAD